MRTTYLTATLLAVACLLAACGGGETAEPIFTPSTSNTSTSPSPSTTDQEAPEDFIRRFVAAGDQMQNTLDSSEYRSMFTKACVSCKNFAELIDKIADAGGSVSFEGSEVLWVRSSGDLFRYRLRSGETRYTENSTSPVIHLVGSEVTDEILLRERGDTWVVEYQAQIAGTAS